MSVEITVREQGVNQAAKIRLLRVPCLYESVIIGDVEFKVVSVRHIPFPTAEPSAEVVVMRFNQGEKAGEQE